MFQITLKNLRESNKLSQAALAKIIGVSQSTVAMWECGKNHPEHAMLLKLSDYFNVSIDYLVGKSKTKINSEKKGVKIPVLGYVRAGIPIDAIEEILDYEEITPEMNESGDYFALKVSGDSMSPVILEGDIIIVRKQPDIESGEIGVVLINGEDATVKQIHKNESGIILQPMNVSKYNPMQYNKKQIEQLPVTIIGKMVELRRKF